MDMIMKGLGRIKDAHLHGTSRLVFFSGEKGITSKIFFIGQTPLAHAHKDRDEAATKFCQGIYP